MTISILEKIGFTTQNGLVFCSALHNEEEIYDAEILARYDAEKLGAKAVFFRRYYRENEEKPYKSEPAVYIFQEGDLQPEDKVKRHAKIWSAGKVDTYIVVDKTRIEIFNARKPAEVNNKELTLEGLKLVSKAVEAFEDARFSSYLFANGTFWEQGDFYDETKSPEFYKNKYIISSLCASSILFF